jgi:hypothetical protein
MIDVHCDHCGLNVKLNDSFAGKKGKCPKCGEVLMIGQPSPKKATQPAGKAGGAWPPQKAKAAPAPAASNQPAPAGGDDPIPFDSLGDEEPVARVVVPNKARLGGEVPDHEQPAEQAGLSKTTAPAAGIHHGDDSDVHVPKHLDLMSHYIICNHKDIIARWQSDGRGWQVRLKDGFARAATVANHIPQFGKFLLIEIGVERRDDGIHLRNVTAFRLQEHYALTKLVHGDDPILATVTGTADVNPRQRGHIRALVRQKFLPHIWPELDELLPDVQDSSGA